MVRGEMMGLTTLLKKGIKKQMGSIVGVFVLLFVISFALVTALTVYANSGSYVNQEMERLGFGDITAWVSKVDDLDKLAAEIDSLDTVDRTGVQPLIFAGYTINGIHSDNEGQLLAYDPAQYPYRFLNDELSGYQDVSSISKGDIYISPAMKSAYNIKIGDKVHFALSRSEDEKVFTVKGYFEDPFMGSSMIDMKSFLISPSDFAEISEQIKQISDFDILARSGAMLHIFQSPGSSISKTGFNSQINTQTSIGNYTEFVYTNSSIYGFMLILQNIFTGFLCAFVVILIVVSMIVMGHSISNTIEQERKDMGILKTIGYTSGQLQTVQILQYMAGIAGGMILGLVGCVFLSDFVSRLTVTSAGLLMPSGLPYGQSLLAFAVILCVLVLFIRFKTIKIAHIPPVQTISSNALNISPGIKAATAIKPSGLTFHLALRQLASGKKRYIGTCIVSILLVFFVSVVGRMDTWLGPNGEGLMDAFSVADHDLGVQPMREVNMKEIESMISSYSRIEETYEVAMQSVTVNGVDYTANVLDQPSRFHILSGRTSTADDEIVITEFVAKDLGVGIGDTVTITHEGKNASYRVTGIYQCANEMGANIGMSREGYAKIGNIDSYIWCHHYILSDHSMNEEIMTTLQKKYRTEIKVHTNSWSGLDGIVSTMHFLTMFMYAIVVIFILVVIVLTGSKLLYAEQGDMAILKSIGFTSHRLRLAFAIRFGIVVAIGSIIGIVLSCILADPVITVLLKLFGIGEFHSAFGFVNSILPAMIVTVLFVAFAYFSSRRIKKVALTALFSR
jgi:ABC-type lipoprotein release transport system permease subunit